MFLCKSGFAGLFLCLRPKFYIVFLFRFSISSKNMKRLRGSEMANLNLETFLRLVLKNAEGEKISGGGKKSAG